MRELEKFYSHDGNERVGFVLSDGSVVEVENISAQPDLSFSVSADDLILYEDEMVATWHTHPNALSNLSMNDYGAFKCWPKIKHYIVGSDGVRCFRVEGSRIVEDE